MLELYAQIMQERFADRVTLTWNVDSAALGGAVPALLLQPLLENAFKHGVERSRDAVRIEIAARRDGERIHIVDPQHGFPAGRRPSRGRRTAQLPRASERPVRRCGEVGADAAP